MNDWNSVRTSQSSILKKIAQKRTEFLNNCAIKFETDSVTPRDYRLIVSVSQKDNLDKLIAFKNKVFLKLKTLELLPSNVLPELFISLVSSIITPDLDKQNQISDYDELKLLKNQSLNFGKTEIKEDLVSFNDTATKVYNVRSYPKEFSLSQMINLLGDSNKESSIPARFILSLTIASVSESNKNNLIARGTSLIAAAEKGHARMTNISEEASEWLSIIRSVNSSGARFLETSFQVSITSNPNKIDDAEAALISNFQSQGFKLDLLKYINLLGILSILPCQASYYFEELQKFKLTQLRLSSEIPALLPIHGEWKGVPEPSVLFVARRGQLFHFNPFYRISSGNYNIAVFGPSGSGKSVFLQEMTACMLASDVKVFILDIGQSYKNLCSLLDGEMIKFSRDMDISLNPFSKLKTAKTQEERDDILTVARSIIYSICGANTKLLMSIVDKALSNLAKSDEDINITNIAEYISHDDSKEASDLAKTMFSYTSSGVYGKYFDRDSNISFDKQITVFEFEEIKGDESLLSVVLQVISMQVFLQVLTGDRKSKFMLIVDEAWMILDYCAKFLGDLARTIRKYGGSLVTCVQNYSDFQTTDERKNILANSTWTIIMQQKKDGIDAMSKYSVFDDILPLVKSVKFKPGKYSELLIMADSLSVVGRLVLDKYSSKIYSTDSKDFAFLSDRVAEGKTMDEALEMLTYKS